MDIGALLKAKQAWSTFKSNHPKFAPFLNAVKQRGIPEGTVVEVEFRYPDGGTMKSNIRVTEEDLQLIDSLRALSGK